MLTEEIPGGSTRIRDLRSVTAHYFQLIYAVVANGWPELKKDYHPLLRDYWREEINAENSLLL